MLVRNLITQVFINLLLQILREGLTTDKLTEAAKLFDLHD